MLRWAARHRFGILIVVWLATLAAWGIDRARAWLDANLSPARHQRMLLYEVDHDVVRGECRRLLADARVIRTATSRPATTQSWMYETVHVPPPGLAVLRPSPGGVLVNTDDGEVAIHFGGGFHHWSLHYFEGGPPGRLTKDLGDGLWFDDEFGHAPSR